LGGPKMVPKRRVFCLSGGGKAFWPQSKRKYESPVDLARGFKEVCAQHKGGKPMFSYKSVVGAFTAAVLVGSSAFAATTTGTLAPGKPAGVNKAQTETGAIILGAAGLGLAAG